MPTIDVCTQTIDFRSQAADLYTDHDVSNLSHQCANVLIKPLIFVFELLMFEMKPTMFEGKLCTFEVKPVLYEVDLSNQWWLKTDFVHWNIKVLKQNYHALIKTLFLIYN